MQALQKGKSGIGTDKMANEYITIERANYYQIPQNPYIPQIIIKKNEKLPNNNVF